MFFNLSAKGPKD